MRRTRILGVICALMWPVLTACDGKSHSAISLHRSNSSSGASVISPPSCSEVACYLAVRTAMPSVEFGSVVSRLAAHGADRSGPASLLAIKKTLGDFSIQASGRKLDTNAILETEGEMILHLRLDEKTEHFSYCRASNHKIQVFDPLLGGGEPIELSKKDLEQAATGNVLVIQQPDRLK